MITALESVQSGLASIVGASRVVSDEKVCSTLSVDGKIPKMVVYPTSGEQVAQALRYAAEQDLAVIACRNATQLGIGNPPRRYDIALSLKEMNRIWHYEPADLTVSVEPGMKLGDFQHFLNRSGLWLPLDPPGGARASLGGILATNSCGPLRLRYGGPRDMVLGMRMATTEGKVVKTGGRVVKNVAGYDLSKLLIGSFGTLGVIVEASLKLFPLPIERATFVLPAGSLETARELRRQILRSPLDPMRLVLLDAEAVKLVAQGARAADEIKGPEIWIEAGGSKRVVGRYARVLEELGRAAGAQTHQLEVEEAERGWSRIADFRIWLAESYPNLVILKAALPISSSEEFLRHAQRETAGMSLASFGQTGVGVVHLNLLDEMATSEAAALIERLRRRAQSLGGTLVIESCPFELKGRLDVWGAAGDDCEVMRKLKEAWDPKGILSPGRFVGGL